MTLCSLPTPLPPPPLRSRDRRTRMSLLAGPAARHRSRYAATRIMHRTAELLHGLIKLSFGSGSAPSDHPIAEALARRLGATARSRCCTCTCTARSRCGTCTCTACARCGTRACTARTARTCSSCTGGRRRRRCTWPPHLRSARTLTPVGGCARRALALVRSHRACFGSALSRPVRTRRTAPSRRFAQPSCSAANRYVQT